MDTAPFAVNAKLPKRMAGLASGEPSAKLPNRADDLAAIEPDTKLPFDARAKLPKPRLSAEERLRRLEEAMAFLRQHLAAGPRQARLSKAGINLSLFTTSSSAADVHDLIQALGYQQVNLYGGSYGTRLALEVMRDFPQHIRSVVMDSTLPPQVDLFTSVPASATRSFTLLFNACAADAACN